MDFEASKLPGTTLLSTNGVMRLVLIPATIEIAGLSRILVVGRYWLTRREWKIAMHLAEGLTRKQIAHQLSLSDDTVATSLSQVYSKLNVRNEKQACLVLGQHGVCGPST